MQWLWRLLLHMHQRSMLTALSYHRVRLYNPLLRLIDTTSCRMELAPLLAHRASES